VIPHVIYQPSIPEVGAAGGYLRYNLLSGDILGDEDQDAPEEQPLETFYDGVVSTDPLVFHVDVGKPFYCPWRGTLSLGGGQVQIDGGAADVGPSTIPCDVTVLLSQPARRPPPRDTTITYRQMNQNGVPIPRGAYAVLVPQSTRIWFYPSGSNNIMEDLTVQPGYPIPLGDLAVGTFGPSEGGTITHVSFLVTVQ